MAKFIFICTVFCLITAHLTFVVSETEKTNQEDYNKEFKDDVWWKTSRSNDQERNDFDNQNKISNLSVENILVNSSSDLKSTKQPLLQTTQTNDEDGDENVSAINKSSVHVDNTLNTENEMELPPLFIDYESPKHTNDEVRNVSVTSKVNKDDGLLPLPLTTSETRKSGQETENQDGTERSSLFVKVSKLQEQFQERFQNVSKPEQNHPQNQQTSEIKDNFDYGFYDIYSDIDKSEVSEEYDILEKESSSTDIDEDGDKHEQSPESKILQPQMLNNEHYQKQPEHLPVNSEFKTSAYNKYAAGDTGVYEEILKDIADDIKDKQYYSKDDDNAYTNETYNSNDKTDSSVNEEKGYFQDKEGYDETRNVNSGGQIIKNDDYEEDFKDDNVDDEKYDSQDTALSDNGEKYQNKGDITKDNSNKEIVEKDDYDNVEEVNQNSDISAIDNAGNMYNGDNKTAVNDPDIQAKDDDYEDISDEYEVKGDKYLKDIKSGYILNNTNLDKKMINDPKDHTLLSNDVNEEDDSASSDSDGDKIDEDFVATEKSSIENTSSDVLPNLGSNSSTWLSILTDLKHDLNDKGKLSQEKTDSDEDYKEDDEDSKEDTEVEKKDEFGILGEHDNDEDYSITKWKEYENNDGVDDKDYDDDNDIDDTDDDDFDESKNHNADKTVDDLSKKSKPLTAPTSMVLFYTWMIVVVLIIIVGISTYQAHCKGIRFLWTKALASTREDHKKLIEHEFV